MIEFIVLLVIWIVITEITFFAFAKDNYEFGDSFISKKLSSLFIGFIITFFTIGIPTLFAFAPREGGLEPFGIIAYTWYYGVILAFVAFFGINYLIYKFIKRDNGN